MTDKRPTYRVPGMDDPQSMLNRSQKKVDRMLQPSNLLRPGAYATAVTPVGAPPPRPFDAPRNPALAAIKVIGAEIAAFESQLTPDEEVGGSLVGTPGGKVFHITAFNALNMDLVAFEGLNDHRRPQRLIQHVTQISLLLTALPKLDETPRRIGFVVEDGDGDAAS